MSATITYPPITDDRMEKYFHAQMQYYLEAGKTSARERILLLNKLEEALFAWKPKIQRALFEDFAKPPQEVDLVDIYYVLREIRYTRARLRRWMQPQHVSTPLAFIGSRSSYYYEAKGVCLLISPWNYPLNLTLGPLVHALAAGCTVIIKPSESTPRTSTLVREMMEATFPQKLVAVIEGDAIVSQKLLTLPFHHIFFTGSPAIGKVIMEAASKTLASVTLELGGKCPVVVCSSANIAQTAHRIVHTKFFNAGQTCIAPDYVLVHQSVHDKLVETILLKLKAFYPSSSEMKTDYCGIIHDGHMGKMLNYLSDAVEKGARIVTGGTQLDDEKLMPTVLTNVPYTSLLMREEIFGPILPIIPYDTIEEAIAFINNLERPLGLYVFGHGKEIRTIMQNTRAGGSCINHCALNYYNPNLPFGGVNNSGAGKSHGFTGFQAFSNVRSVYHQVWPYSPIDWLHAPYTKAKQWLIDFVLKWL